MTDELTTKHTSEATSRTRAPSGALVENIKYNGYNRCRSCLSINPRPSDRDRSNFYFGDYKKGMSHPGVVNNHYKVTKYIIIGEE